MKYSQENRDHIISTTEISRDNLRANCKDCFGFCCVALYFSASEGFPVNKDAGKPCMNLQLDFSCGVHKDLKKLGLKGCLSYDCFGAGQKVAQFTYKGQDWRKIPEAANQMYEVFLIMRQFHEMLWYLTEAITLVSADPIGDEIHCILKETHRITFLSHEELTEFDIVSHRENVNSFILQASEGVRSKVHSGQMSSTTKHQKTIGRGVDFIGADLRKIDLRGKNLRGAYLIAANLRGVDLSGADLIGVDMRDADIRGANLTNSIFVTQAQINAAKGDSNTKLPMWISRPISWSDCV